MEIFDIENSVIPAETLHEGVDFVSEFSAELKQYEGRVTGSSDETACARAIRSRLAQETDASVRLEAYRAFPLVGRGSLPFFGLWYLLCYVLYFVSFVGGVTTGILLTVLALAVFAVGCGFMATLYFSKQRLRKILTQKVSYNVVSEFSKNTDKLKKERVFIIADNHDAALAGFVSNSRLMSKIAHIFVPLTAIVFVLFCILKMAIGADTTEKITAFSVIPSVIGVLGIAATVLRFSPFERHAKQNNGIATAVAMTTFAYFAEQPDLLPDDVRIVYASFGGENSGHGGSEAFVKSHPEFSGAQVLCLGDIESADIRIADRNAIRRITYSTPFVSIVRSSAHEQKIDVTTLPNDNLSQKLKSIHGYISDAFAQNGNPTATIVAEEHRSGERTLEPNDLEKLLSVTVGTFLKLINETTPASKDKEIIKEQQKKTSSEMEIHSASGK